MFGKRTPLRILLLLLAIFAWQPLARAVEPDEVLKDPVLELRARQISTGLRCLVCQNQSIDDSNAPLARDLRVLVRDRLQQGDSDRAVLDFVVSRYGSFVLLKPPFSISTLLLWLAPLGLLMVGGIAARRTYARSKAQDIPVTALTTEEQARIAKLLEKP